MNANVEGYAETQPDFFEDRASMARSDFVFTNDHLRSLVDQLPTLVAFWDADLICRFANHAYSYWFGVNHLRLPGSAKQALLGPKLFAKNEPMIRAVLRGERQDFDRLMICADGISRNALVTYLPITVDGVTAGFIVHTVEVNRLKAAEAALREEIAEHRRTIEALAAAADRIRLNEATFQQTLRLNAQMAWAASPDGSSTHINEFWDEAWQEVAGQVQLADVKQNIMTIIHKDDRERALSNLAQGGSSPTTSDERYRVTDRAGGVRWMRFRTAPYFDESGELKQWLGLIEDIDVTVRAEERQQERDTAYRLTIDLSGKIPWSMNADGTVLSINDAASARWAALTGRPAVEPSMDYATAAVHPDDLDRALADGAAAIESGLPLDFRYRLRLVDGSYRWWRSCGSPLRDAEGNILRWYGTLEDIHDQVLGEERQQERDTAYRLTIDLSGKIPYSMSADGSVLSINEAAAAQWAALTGRATVGNGKNFGRSAIHPDDRDRVVAATAAAIASGLRLDIRYRFRMVDGSYRWWGVCASPHRDTEGNILRWYGTLEDIHDQVLGEERQQERDAAYRLTIDLSGKIPFSQNADGTVLSINDDAAARWAALTGRPAEDRTIAFGKAAVHPDDFDRALAAASAAVASGLPIDSRYRLKMVDGSYKWWRSCASAHRDAEGNILRWYGTFEDIHDEVVGEERLQRLEMEVAHFARLGAMESMASTLAHELNQPLAAVVNYVSGARRLLATGDTVKVALAESALVAAEAAALRSGQIIRSLRKMVAKGGINRQSEQVAKLIDDACVLAMIDARARGIVFRTEVDADVTTIWVDGVQLNQVLINLLRNAMDAVETAPVREVRIAARLRGASVEISVSDTGKGIDPDLLDRLFGAFTSTKPEGLGIGLSICRTIVEANGGTITYAKASNGGACFTVSIPVAA